MKFLTSALIVFFSFSTVFPHSCAAWNQWSDEEYYKHLEIFNVIFFGEIISVTNAEENRTQIIKFKVIRAWKGIESEEVTVKYGNPCDNGIPMSRQKGMVYGIKSSNPSLIEVNCCNFGVSNDERIKIKYGEGRVFEKPPNATEQTMQQESFWSWLWKQITSIFS